MENSILSNELISAINAVADLIKSDPRHTDIVNAAANYSSNEEMKSILDEYQALMIAFNEEEAKEDHDDNTLKVMKERLDSLYDTVMEHPVYVAYREANEAYSHFTEAIYDELEFAVTGHRRDEGCTHDCSTCGGCH